MTTSLAFLINFKSISRQQFSDFCAEIKTKKIVNIEWKKAQTKCAIRKSEML